MQRVGINIGIKALLISFPKEYRNKMWAECFGDIQNTLRNLSSGIEEIIVDVSKCIWCDPLPLLSILIALREDNVDDVRKKLYLPSLDRLHTGQKKFLAFIEKEGFIDNFIEAGAEILVLTENEIIDEYSEEYRINIQSYDKYLDFYDCTVLEAKIIDLANEEIVSKGIGDYIDEELSIIRHRLKLETLGVIEKETFSKVSLFLKEAIENVSEHAYGDSNKKLVGYYVRSRIGLGDKSLDGDSRNRLKKVISDEHLNSPRLTRWFLENISSFIEIFVIDSGIGLTNNYFRNCKKRKLFREAWRETIGLGLRGKKSRKKNTEFGGLYTLSRLCRNNYLAARDYTEWLGDTLPIVGNNPKYEANRSYELINAKKQIEGLSLICRISWKEINDENTSWIKLKEFNDQERLINPYYSALSEDKDIYMKYFNKKFSELKSNPFLIYDERIEFDDKQLKEKYLNVKGDVDYCLYLPSERKIKNQIYNFIVKELNVTRVQKKVLIIADIEVWDANVYQLALENAKYSKVFLNNIDKILLVTRRLSICLLIKKSNSYKFDKEISKDFIEYIPDEFRPDLSFLHLVELLRCHDSMIFWSYIKKMNMNGEFFLNKKITWYQGGKDIGLKGYLNFARTLIDGFCRKIYEYSLERSLCLSNYNGCIYKSIDVLTDRLSDQYNSLYYNRGDEGSEIILLGSVYVSGYSERSKEIDVALKGAKYKIHFFCNRGVEKKYYDNPIPQLLLWPSKGQNWINEKDIDIKHTGAGSIDYRRVGTSHAIAPFGWKYFPIPRYRLYDETKKCYISDVPGFEKTYDGGYTFKSVYKCPPSETYMEWQGKRSQILSLGHFCYESSHDIFKIDIPFVVNESFLVGGKLSQFLVAEFLNALGANQDSIIDIENKVLINGVEKYLKEEYSGVVMNLFKSVLIVYPYHYNSEYVINEIKKRINKKLHDRIIALFPVYKKGRNSIYLVSPLTIEILKNKINEHRKDNPGDKINVLLFDDVVITGNSRKEIKHILFSLGVDTVTTLIILERRRLPFSTSDPRYNKAYWRLDIPKLGYESSCPICNVLSKIKNIKNNIASINIIKRLEEIEDLWKEITPYNNNYKQIITPTNIIAKKISHKYGIYYNDNVFKQCGGDNYKIEISNSLGLAIYVSEIFTMTARDDIIFKYLESDDISVYVKIEMLSLYLLLFGGDLSGLTREKIIRELFKICDGCDYNNYTSFALLSLMSQGEERLGFLYDIIKDPNEMDIKISNFDMQILCLLNSIDSKSKFYNSISLVRLKKGYKSIKDLYKQFHSEIFNDYGGVHDTPLMIIIKGEYTEKTLRESEDSLDKINYLLENIHAWYLRDTDDEKYRFEDVCRSIKDKTYKYREESLKIKVDDKENKVKKIINIGDDIFRSLRTIHDKLFINIGLKSDDFPIMSELEKLIDKEKEVMGIDFSCNFKKLQLTDDLVQVERWISWDRGVERKMSYILNNTKYAKCECNDPYDMNSEEKKAWLDVEYYDSLGYLMLCIYNKSHQKSNQVKQKTALKNKPEKLHLKELDIEIDYEDNYINGEHYLKTKVKFPYI